MKAMFLIASIVAGLVCTVQSANAQYGGSVSAEIIRPVGSVPANPNGFIDITGLSKHNIRITGLPDTTTRMIVTFDLYIAGNQAHDGVHGRNPDGSYQPAYVATPNGVYDSGNAQVPLFVTLGLGRYGTRAVTEAKIGDFSRKADIPGVFDVVPAPVIPPDDRGGINPRNP